MVESGANETRKVLVKTAQKPRRPVGTIERLRRPEAHLYHQVSEYVREEMNRAERLRAKGEGRRGSAVGFALTTLQRRLHPRPK